MGPDELDPALAAPDCAPVALGCALLEDDDALVSADDGVAVEDDDALPPELHAASALAATAMSAMVRGLSLFTCHP